MRFVERAAKKAAAKGGARYFERTGTAWQFMKVREIVEKLGRMEKWLEGERGGGRKIILKEGRWDIQWPLLSIFSCPGKI